MTCCDDGGLSSAPGQQFNGGLKRAHTSLVVPRQLIEALLEAKLESKDNELRLHNILFRQFEYLIKKHGFKGILKYKQFEAVQLTRKYLKREYLESHTSRHSAYFNSDLIMVSD